MKWFEYHDLTKHSVERLHSSPHYLDWANMPDPFRHYEGVPVVDLPADALAPRARLLDVLRQEKGQNCETNSLLPFVSQLLFHSAAISATKFVPQTGYRYALRVNPSSGNLHPTEFHIATRDALYHYRPSSHELELRATGDYTQGRGEVVFYLTSIFWREAWKYRNRAYRYCLHDMGHAWESLTVAARACGYQVEATGQFEDDQVHRELRLPEDEQLLLIATLTGPPLERMELSPEWFRGTPNPLSAEIVDYIAIEEIHKTTKTVLISGTGPDLRTVGGAILLAPEVSSDVSFAEGVRRRRSALDFEGGERTITFGQFSSLVDVALRPHYADFADRYITLHSFVHRVDGLERGLYRCDARSVELLQPGDHRVAAAGLSLSQQLAGNSCVTFSMVADLKRATYMWGDRGYRYAFFEAGAIGQRLYLAAEAMGFQSTGIGAFYDDAVHDYLKLAPGEGQVIYHFASGYAVKDRRLNAQ
ncbi:MAG: SagB/ThcOx family dehydrogenase [Bryobacterales bacterium]|nr:SagB/ThcOx family dehydrogenase [Bryobacterales bacterium]